MEKAKTLKKALSWMIVGTMLFGLAGCGKAASENANQTEKNQEPAATAENSAGTDAKSLRIAYSMDSLTEGMVAQMEGVDEAIAAFNNSQSGYTASIDYFNAASDVEKQISDVETIIQNGYDILMFSSVDTSGSLPAMKAAYDAGLTVVDTRKMDQLDSCSISLDFCNEPLQGEFMRNWMQALLDDGKAEALHVGIVYGAAAQTYQLERGDFVKRWAEEDPEHIIVEADAYGDWDAEKSQSIMEDWIQAHPEINIVVTGNTAEALGVANALIGAQKKETTWVVSFDITNEALIRIQDGTLDCAVGFSPKDNGRSMTEMGLKVFMGEYEGEKEYKDDHVQYVDATNIEAYLAENPIEK
ncbi:sugar ABC transporter substrate-binding protein [Lachnospiraceae bacterium ASD3451]|uniref:sugar ABC transporter substrate-binding protein n=1 Tax=Diplocloster agilis TaxID=2850323 RepID=UPI001D5E81FD|nr:sugar ABC transporter substrate-binding protein [Diplocloster agilis]MBU9742951.1 sugar ABC transporter substrate-binding protein [Diplocloster agilis]